MQTKREGKAAHVDVHTVLHVHCTRKTFPFELTFHYTANYCDAGLHKLPRISYLCSSLCKTDAWKIAKHKPAPARLDLARLTCNAAKMAPQDG
eukprot:1075219-Amphidinium_carterae.1